MNEHRCTINCMFNTCDILAGKWRSENARLKSRIEELEKEIAQSNYWRKRWSDDYTTASEKLQDRFVEAKKLKSRVSELEAEIDEGESTR